MRITFDLDNEIAQSLIQQHLEDSETVAEKVASLIVLGVAVNSHWLAKRRLLSIDTKVTDRQLQYVTFEEFNGAKYKEPA